MKCLLLLLLLEACMHYWHFDLQPVSGYGRDKVSYGQAFPQVYLKAKLSSSKTHHFLGLDLLLTQAVCLQISYMQQIEAAIKAGSLNQLQKHGFPMPLLEINNGMLLINGAMTILLHDDAIEVLLSSILTKAQMYS